MHKFLFVLSCSNCECTVFETQYKKTTALIVYLSGDFKWCKVGLSHRVIRIPQQVRFAIVLHRVTRAFHVSVDELTYWTYTLPAAAWLHRPASASTWPTDPLTDSFVATTNRNVVTAFNGFLTARRYAIAQVLAMALWPSLSVCQKSVFYQKGWTD